MRTAFFFAVAVILSGTVGALDRQTPNSSTEDRLVTRFWAYTDTMPPESVRDAYVYVLTKRGVTDAGRTNRSGEVTITKDRLLSPESLALLICRDQTGIVCAAIRLDTRVIEGFDEFNLQVPTLKIIDRIYIDPR